MSHDVPDSDDEFDESPRPVKRQKVRGDATNRTGAGRNLGKGLSKPSRKAARQLDDIESDEDDAFDTMPMRKPGSTTAIRHDIDKSDEETGLPTKPKHRIHVPTNADTMADVVMSQAPLGGSSPDRVRGPIWLKKPPLPLPAPSISTASRTAQQSGNQAKPAMMSATATRDNGFRFPKPLQAANINTIAEPSRATSAEGMFKSMPLQSSKPAVNSNVIIDVADELADLPSDAFSSPTASPTKSPDRTIYISSQTVTAPPRPKNMRAPQTGLKQTTLFGTSAEMSTDQPKTKKHSWPMATQQEHPTHHKLNEEAMSTWVYPTNLGKIRDYQYSIVSTGLYHNLLVALPTGLGKTFIAATIMLNWYRWTKDAQIVFVAPTKPLVAQQVDACFHIVGIPRSQTVMLTGTTQPGLRAEEWKTKRVFFMTPQTIINDLKTGLCDPKRIVLLVVDEAHRATGNYAYVEVVKFLRRFNQSFRVLALTATPGSKVESVQQVIDGLDISRVEIRTEESLDLRQYVFSREVQSEPFDYSAEQAMVMELFSKAVSPVLNQLAGQNAYWGRDPMKLTAFGLTQAQRQWQGSEAGRKAQPGIKNMVFSCFKVLAKLAHSISMLKFHGIGPFFRGISDFRNEVDSGTTKGKNALAIRNNENFVKMNSMVQTWINNPDFIGHPKLEHLREVILNHFMDAGEGKDGIAPSATRVMVFAAFRESAEEINRVLRRNDPMIRPHVFVGQADSKGSEGMDQKKQLEVIQQFKDGKYNVLVATSIGEEGLDIGEVDLIVCYDASASPIRMLQRMGRTGRKRRGKIVLLLMKDKEQRDFEAAKDNYEKMQAMISNGDRFTFHDDRSPRILPKQIQPVADKRVVEIPQENSQADLPEPKKTGKRAPKRPPKKFHMPDGVRTGFVSVSRMQAEDDGSEDEEEEIGRAKLKPKKRVAAPTPRKVKPPPEPEIAQLPFLEDVLLGKVQERELERKYQYVNDVEGPAVVTAPRLDQFPGLFRLPGRTKFVKHGEATTRLASTLERMHTMDQHKINGFQSRVDMSDVSGNVDHLIGNVAQARIQSENESEGHEVTLLAKKSRAAAQPKAAAKPRAKPKPKAKTKTPAKAQKSYRHDDDAMEGESSSPEPTPANMRIATQGIDLGSDDTEGDEAADEEPDSELAAFVVASSQPIEYASSSQPLGTRGSLARDLFMSQESVVSHGTEAGLPDVRTVMGRSRDSSETVEAVPSRKRKLKKRQVVESDSDE